MFRTFWTKLHPNTDENGFRQYQPHRSVFSVPNPALPRNIRSLFLASERYTMKYPLLKRSRMLHLRWMSHNTKWNQVFLTGIFVFLSAFLLITIIVLLVFLIQFSTEKTIDKTEEQTKDQTISHLYSSHSGTENTSDRTRCYKTCWPYTAFRFESVCQYGYCYCKGSGYDNWTCLPIFGDCVISRNPSNAVAFLRDKHQDTFGCHTSPSSQPANKTQVYVISVMNDKQFHHSLTVSVTALSAGLSHITRWPFKLVLASYYPVHWSVATDSRLNLSSVIQISTVRAHKGKLTVNGKNLTEDNKHYIRHRSLVGYGDDRDSGHTLRLLETIQKIAGNFTSFSGAKEADRWQLTIQADSTMETPRRQTHFFMTEEDKKNATEETMDTTILSSG